MNKLLQAFANLPAGAKAAILIAAILVVAGAVYVFGGTIAIYVVVAGLVITGLLLGSYRAILTMLSRRKSAPMERSIASNAGMTPMAITEPARRARLDDLRKNFEGGVDKFRAAGKNLYALPWYLLVGEPGSGKTEAVRHCNVGFPPGLQDQLQGAGGTLNMNWWFTNHAVILDTAGRLLFEEVEPGASNEWQEFLKLLKRNRPNCPINGMLLVIPAESLIRDSADAIEQKGSRIAQQLDAIQRALGVRFPVFVLITKCDLINGFREFFDEITDPALQHQVLGWSNPSPLDRPFSPELVEEHLRTVQQRLAKRRAGLLIDPVNTENPSKPRTDQVDALYAFPDAMMRIAPRLRRYLEMIFVSGEWATKPLFLRGIYFTSSMREGAALDQELAEAFGVPIENLPEGRVWERDRAFFLRDLFMNKVFREKGLVTRAVSTQQQQRVRNIAVYGAATAGLLAVGLFTWLGARSLGSTIVKPADLWTQASHVYLNPTNGINLDPAKVDDPRLGKQNLPIVSKATNGSPDFRYRGGTGEDAGQLSDFPIAAERRTRVGVIAELRDQATAPLAVPAVFRPVAGLLGDDSHSLAQAQRLEAARVIFEGSILRPLIDACKLNLQQDVAAGPLPPEAAGAIEQLALLEQECAGAASTGGPAHQLLNLEPLMRFALRGNTDFVDKGAQKDIPTLTDAYRDLYPGEAWPPATIKTLYAHVIPDGVPHPTSVPVAGQPTHPAPPATPDHASNPPPVQPPSTGSAQVARVSDKDLKFPLAPFTTADAELTPEGFVAVRDAIQKQREGQHGNLSASDRRIDALLKALPTASHPTQFCTISVLPKEPPSLGKDGLIAGAPFVSIVAVGGEPRSTVPLGGAAEEVKLTKLRAPGTGFESKFFPSEHPTATPVATLTVPSRWGGMYLIDHFHGQPTHPGDRHIWDVEVDVGAPGATKSVWLRLEFDSELPELPWYP